MQERARPQSSFGSGYKLARGCSVLCGRLFFGIWLLDWYYVLEVAGQVVPGANSCPLNLTREDAQELCDNLKLPPPGAFNASAGGPPPPPSCCQLAMNYWLAKRVNATDGGSFFMTLPQSQACVDKFMIEIRPNLGVIAAQCPALDPKIYAYDTRTLCRDTNFITTASMLAKNNFSAVNATCDLNLNNPENCAACGQQIYETGRSVAGGFPQAECITAANIIAGSRDVSPIRWLSVSNCLGLHVTATVGGGFTFPPGPGGPPGPGLAPKKKKGLSLVVIIIPAVAGLALLIALAACFFCFCRARLPDIYIKNDDEMSAAPSRLLISGHLSHVQLEQYLYSELAAATENFAEKNRVGTGGSADVYRGLLEGGKIVAIKKLLKITVAEKEFVNELMVVGGIRHWNLANLVGYSMSSMGFLLVFDYYPNGSLEDALFKEGYPTLLSWKQATVIVLGVAKAISHLHNISNGREGEQKVIHRDIKPSNILLDADFQPHVSDFGVSRNLQLEQTHVTTKIMGTFGYVAPEYAGTGKLTDKSDVYSFGVMLLVVMSKRQPAGRDASKYGAEGIVESAFQLAREDRLTSLIHEDYSGQLSQDEAQRYLSIALLCVQPDNKSRPSFESITAMLDGRGDVPPVPIPAERQASSILPGLRRLVYGTLGDTQHTGDSTTFTTTTIESLNSSDVGEGRDSGGYLGSSERERRDVERGSTNVGS